MKRIRLSSVWTILLFALLPSSTQSVVAGEGLEPSEALKAFHLAEGLRIELVVCEPDVVSPVAIAWDEFGRLYVVEMLDYPDGPGEGKPFLSRVKLLEDKDGDGRYETVRVFVEGLPFANGVMPWAGGVIVTAAPDIWFFKDTDSDGRADAKEKLFTGFKEGNPQLRVNHPTLGIDNWIYVANGLSGGEVTKPGEGDKKIPIPQMDFRFRPDRGEYEATAGNAQFGLAFDDIGNRFLCSNRQHVAHVVLPDRYLKRNPYLAVAKTVLDVPDHGAAARIFPLATTRTTAVEHAGTFTAACGLLIYRGTSLPKPYRGNSFICDPTGYLVHRDLLVPTGPTFVARRAPEEARREFLASTDEWFRPVNLANAPDGALYVVDMYRETIEHPQYMPKGLAETLDLRKGDDRGRIWRIVGLQGQRSIETWPGTMEMHQLVELLRHPDSWWRETAQRLLIERNPSGAARALRRLVRTAIEPMGRVHALWTLEGLHELDRQSICVALADSEPAVREHAVRLAESRLNKPQSLFEDVELLFQKALELQNDSDPRVRFQLALSLNSMLVELSDLRETRFSGQATMEHTHRLVAEASRIKALAGIADRDAMDEWTLLAVLSSASTASGRLFSELVGATPFTQEPMATKAKFVEQLAAIVGRRNNADELEGLLTTLGSRQAEADTWWQLAALTGLADGLRGHGQTLPHLLGAGGEKLSGLLERIAQLLAQAPAIARDSHRPVADRVSAIRLLGQLSLSETLPIHQELLAINQPHEVQLASVHTLASVSDPGVGPLLLEGWDSHSPPVRREVLEAVFSRRERLVQLLDAMEAGTIKAAELDMQRHHQLLNHGVEEIKSRAAKIFENEGTPNRKEVIESYRTILTKTGDIDRGHEVFKKNCATCHQVLGQGHRVGPELTGLRTRNNEALLMDILDPNRALEPNYANYLVATKDGRVMSGIIASESATSITLRRAEGAEETLLRQEIEQIRASGQSLMPEGLERTIAQGEMIDLIEFLKSIP